MKRIKIMIVSILGILFVLCIFFFRPQRYQGRITVSSLDGEVLELELDVVLYKNRLHIGKSGGMLTDKLYGTIVMDGQTYWSEWDLWDERNMSRADAASFYMFFTSTDSLFNDPACTCIMMDMEPGFKNMRFWVIRRDEEDTMYYRSACR